MLACLNLVVSIPEKVKRDVKAVTHSIFIMVIAAADKKLSRGRNLRNLVQKTSQEFRQLLVLSK